MALFFVGIWGCAFLSDQKGTKESPGDAAIGRAASRPVLHVGLPPDPITGDASRETVPRIRRGQGRGLPSVPRRCRWPGKGERAVRLDGESAPGASSRRGWFDTGGWGRFPLSGGNGRRPKRVGIIRPYRKAAVLGVGAGVLTGPSSTAQPNSMAQARRTRLEHLAPTFAAPGPSGPEGERAATQDLPAGRDFLPKGPGKNGVLVPLPPRAKEPAAGAAELPICVGVPF